MQIKGLTEKQKALLGFIDNYQKEHKVRPTLVEMGNHFGLKISAIQSRIYQLERKGVLERKNIYIIKEL